MSTNYRIEKDFLGEKQIPADAYYGVQTQRGKDNFHITGTPMSSEPYFVMAFGYVKKAAALANHELGLLDEARCAAHSWRSCCSSASKRWLMRCFSSSCCLMKRCCSAWDSVLSSSWRRRLAETSLLMR